VKNRPTYILFMYRSLVNIYEHAWCLFLIKNIKLGSVLHTHLRYERTISIYVHVATSGATVFPSIAHARDRLFKIRVQSAGVTVSSVGIVYIC